jgi:hypothetical protein
VKTVKIAGYVVAVALALTALAYAGDVEAERYAHSYAAYTRMFKHQVCPAFVSPKGEWRSADAFKTTGACRIEWYYADNSQWASSSRLSARSFFNGDFSDRAARWIIIDRSTHMK